MGIFDALTSAVAGLQAQSFALQNISGNIANSQTTAFKETDTSFQDLVSAASLGQQTSGGVFASSVSTNTVQGTIQTESVSTDMAINGDGYFVVAQPTGYTDNQPNFNSVDFYTRRGDFQTNQDGYLVNGAGYYLMGIPVDSVTGNPVGSVPQVLQFNSNFVPAQATTQIQYQANLPSTPASLLTPSAFEANPLAGAPIAAEIAGTGATLLPDKAASGTGTVSGLTAGTTLASLNVNVGDTITVNDGTNTTTYTAAAGDTINTLMTAINGGSAQVTASINGAGNLVLTGNNDVASITVGGTASADIGFGAGQNAFQPTNLLTQSAVAQGQTLTVTVGTFSGNPPTISGTPQTITFGTQAGQVATLAQLQTAVQGLTGVTGTVDTSNGNISLTATNPSDDIQLSGTASTAKFGIENLTAYPASGTVMANDVSTFNAQSVDGGSVTAYDSKGDPVNVDFRWAKISSSSNGGTDSGSFSIRAIRAQPAHRPPGRTSAPHSHSIQAVNLVLQFPP